MLNLSGQVRHQLTCNQSSAPSQQNVYRVGQFLLQLLVNISSHFASSSPSLLASHIEQGQVLFQQTWATIDMIVGLPGAGQVFMKLDIFVLMFRSEHEIQICRLAFLGLGL